MAEYDDIRTDLDNFVFTPYGKVVTFISKSSPIYNTRGELENITNTSSSATIVPYNIAFNRQSHQTFGDLKEGDMDAALRYSVSVEIDDVFTIDSVNWRVKLIEKNYLPENVVTIVRLTKDI
jgi:1-aminocyclopropane-1-carboxylate deaminase/D-cysteine desulfhydrase-like pyridoxal-dependent ACC family enzyme